MLDKHTNVCYNRISFMAQKIIRFKRYEFSRLATQGADAQSNEGCDATDGCNEIRDQLFGSRED